ncbi:hypothetical protein B0H11DRAFT_2260189 [Mycena galericulata]|nr:hypothetical protein B0H11DRAFT_2260189 [Mycena galericulata]
MAKTRARASTQGRPAPKSKPPQRKKAPQKPKTTSRSKQKKNAPATKEQEEDELGAGDGGDGDGAPSEISSRATPELPARDASPDASSGPLIPPITTAVTLGPEETVKTSRQRRRRAPVLFPPQDALKNS